MTKNDLCPDKHRQMKKRAQPNRLSRPFYGKAVTILRDGRRAKRYSAQTLILFPSSEIHETAALIRF